jgi:hypothetical protein
MLSPWYRAFAQRVKEMRGDQSQAAFAAHLNTQSPPRVIAAAYISLAESGKSDGPACPVWFVQWFCGKFKLNVPPEYTDRQTKNHQHQCKIKRQVTTSPTAEDNAALIKRAETAEARLAAVEQRVKSLETTNRRYFDQIKQLQESVQTGQIHDLYSADANFIDILCREVHAEMARLRSTGQYSAAHLLSHQLESAVTTITLLLEGLTVGPNKEVRERCKG